MNRAVEVTVSGENFGIVAGGDVKDANLIRTGDVLGSYNAIGAGAQVIVQQVQAISALEERQQANQFGQARLATAITAKVNDYTAQLDRRRDETRRNPYKDLSAYQLADAPFFFGREVAIASLLDRIHQAPLTVLHAASGAGKSSLLQAGLMSRLLAAGHLPLYVRTRARNDARSATPLGLVEVIKAAFLPDIAHDPTLVALQTTSLLGFLTDVRRSLGGSSLYIFLDQFEDFFNDALLPAALRLPFVAAINACLEEPALDVRWILALRKEFYSDLYIFGDAVFHNQLYLPGLTATEAECAIVAPAHHWQVEYAAGLVAQILDDLQPRDAPMATNSPSAHFAPTQIQLVCHRLFAELAPAATLIDWPLYTKSRGLQQLPGAAGILTDHLQTVLSTQLPATMRSVAILLLQELVSAQAQRLPHSMAELVERARLQQAHVTEAAVHQVLDALVNNRLLQRDEHDGVAYYELVHDYLITEITSWLSEEERERKQVRELLLQEVNKARGFGTTLNPPLMDLIDRHQEGLNLASPAGVLLLQSALQNDYQVEHWLQLVTDATSRYDALANVITHGTEPAQLKALALIVTTPDAATLELLQRTALEDANPHIREQAAKSLARLAGPDSLAPLGELAQAASKATARRAVEALAYILDAYDYGARLSWRLRLKVNAHLLWIRFGKYRRQMLAEIGGATVAGMAMGLIAIWAIYAMDTNGPITAIIVGLVFGMTFGFITGAFVAAALTLRYFFRAHIGALWVAFGAAFGGGAAAILWYNFVEIINATGSSLPYMAIFAITFGALWGIALWGAQRRQPALRNEDARTVIGITGVLAALVSALTSESLVAANLITRGFDGAPLMRLIGFFAVGAAIALGLSHPGWPRLRRAKRPVATVQPPG